MSRKEDPERDPASEERDDHAVEPWGYPLWMHLHDEHGLTLLESQLADIVRIARTIPVWEDDL